MNTTPDTILVVDDTPDNIAVLSGILSDQYRVLAATSGEKALRMARDKMPNLILLDVMMPDMDGYEVCRRLKADPDTRGIPVIFVTAMNEMEDETRGLSEGAVDYITKPIRPPVVLQRVRTHLELQNAKRQVDLLNTRFASYLSPELSSSIQSGRIQATVSSHRKKLSIFFSDIVGFTSQTESLEPEDMTHLLNSYFECMNGIVAKYGGTLDKYIGDAMLVFFGDPQSSGVREDALACVEMALEMQRSLEILRADWLHQGIVNPLQVRMGIATGYVTVGSFGSSHKLDYTIIGTPVNLASRLQSHAEVGAVLISQETWQLVHEQFPCIVMEPVAVKGFSQPVQSYRLLDSDQRHWIAFEAGDNHLRICPETLSSAEKLRLRSEMLSVLRQIEL